MQFGIIRDPHIFCFREDVHMTLQQIERYRSYAGSEEAFAVLFVKKYLKSADSRYWVHITCSSAYNAEALRFKLVQCELVPRATESAYPGKWEFRNERDYIQACRAATWEAACYDIDRFHNRGRSGRKFEIAGVSWPLDCHECKLKACTDPDKYFVPEAPPEIRALAQDLSDRTDPLWDEAMRWVSPEYGGTVPDVMDRFGGCDEDDGYGFRIRYVRRI